MQLIAMFVEEYSIDMRSHAIFCDD